MLLWRSFHCKSTTLSSLSIHWLTHLRLINVFQKGRKENCKDRRMWCKMHENVKIVVARTSFESKWEHTQAFVHQLKLNGKLKRLDYWKRILSTPLWNNIRFVQNVADFSLYREGGAHANAKDIGERFPHHLKRFILNHSYRQPYGQFNQPTFLFMF